MTIQTDKEIDSLIDSFVDYVNSSEPEPEFEKDVPPFLRRGPAITGTKSDELFKWAIVPSDNLKRIDSLEKRIGINFPKSFRSLLTRYSYPAFEVGKIMLFANSGVDLFWEYEKNFFADKYLTNTLLENGFLYMGHPHFSNYNPICFNISKGIPEPPIVNIDHEEILCKGKLRVIEQIEDSFPKYINSIIGM